MLKELSSLSRNKSSVFLLVLALIVGGISAQATGLLNTSSGGYLVCVNSTTKVVTHPGTANCPKGNTKLILGAKGASGLTGAVGLSGKDGRDGLDGKTLWNGVKDPESTWGAPGDMFINAVTKVLFGPKNLDGSWPIGVSMVGPAGAIGLTGLTGLTGPGGSNGGPFEGSIDSNDSNTETNNNVETNRTGRGLEIGVQILGAILNSATQSRTTTTNRNSGSSTNTNKQVETNTNSNTNSNAKNTSSAGDGEGTGKKPSSSTSTNNKQCIIC
jgi:hypothetical protein